MRKTPQDVIKNQVEKINKNMSEEERAELLRRAEKADHLRMREAEYNNETNMFVQCQGQFLSTIMNGFISHHGSYTMDAYEAHYETASKMAANYVRRLNNYKKEREDNMPDFNNEEIQ